MIGWPNRACCSICLVKADRKHGTRRSNRYYELAMRLAHVTAATDLVPSSDEVQAIDAYRTRLLQAMDAAGVARPGQPDQPRPQPTPAEVAPRPAATAPTAGRHRHEADAPAGAIDRRGDGRARRA